MKKKLFIGLTSAVALAAAAIITVSAVNATGTPESDLLAKNLEVLTQIENGGTDCSYMATYTFYPDGCGGGQDVYTYGCTSSDGRGSCYTGYETYQYDCNGWSVWSSSDRYIVSC